MRWIALILLLLLLIPGPAWSEEAKPLAADPVAEARLKQLAVELRCLVCQNQTLADSNAPLAEDLRREVREMIAKNMTDEQIIDFLVTRYGDFVRYRPPFKMTTFLLWVGPFLLLAVGATVLAVSLRRRAQKKDEGTLSHEEQARVAQLLDGKKGSTV
jgi:cytochrome c-type biogenesis protein CcmH